MTQPEVLFVQKLRVDLNEIQYVSGSTIKKRGGQPRASTGQLRCRLCPTAVGVNRKEGMKNDTRPS